MTTAPLPPALVAAGLLALLVWSVWCGGTVARMAGAGRAHRLAAGLVALLLLPGSAVAVTMADAAAARAVRDVAWLWLAVTLLALPQPLAALGRDRSPGWLVWPATGWNLLATLDAAARLADTWGYVLPDALLAAAHAPRLAWVDALGVPALDTGWPLVVPLLVPVWPPRQRITRWVHAALATIALTGIGAAALALPASVEGIASFARFDEEPLRERPAGDFAIGLGWRAPDVGMPPDGLAETEVATVGWLEAEAVHLRVSAAARAAALDSVGRLLDARRRAGAVVLVELRGLDRRALDGADDSTRITRVVRALGAATYVVSGPWEAAPLDAWRTRVSRRSAAVRVARDRAGAVPAVAVRAADGARHEWAAGPDGTVDAIVLALDPDVRGAAPLLAQLERWDRRLAEAATGRAYWVVGAGAVPPVHGARAQRQAMQGVVAWASNERQVRGVIVADAVDAGRLQGIRTAAGRWRPAAGAVLAWNRALREMRAAPPPPVVVPSAAADDPLNPP